MVEQSGSHIILFLQKKWKTHNILFCGLLSLAIAVAAGGLLHSIWQVSWWMALPVWLVVFTLLLFSFPFWKISTTEVARFLNGTVAEAEESCGLLLQPAAELTALQQLQVNKIDTTLRSARLPHPFKKKLLTAALLLLVACVCSTVLVLFGKSPAQAAANTAVIVPKEKILPGITGVTIQITPPAYTGKAVRKQEQFNLQVEEGAVLQWQLKTNVAMEAVQLMMNDSTLIALHPDSEHTTWSTDKVNAHSGFYQVRLQDKVSELYKLEVIRDEEPVVAVYTPQPYTIIDFGRPGKVPLKLSVKDDYGISNAVIIATIASGSGEGVQFKEKTLAFDNSFAGNQSAYELQKTIDLPGLGLKPGDELYFYIKATDNHRQSTSSDMYIITLPDTAQLMSLDGLVMGLDVQPEYFRSQRQIIIETEQLLRSKDTMSVQAFNQKSNDLGIDQKLLRLRYGKFLGEESETNIGDPRVEEADHDDHGHAEEKVEFGDTKAILDAVSHKHDQAEDATFFEPAIKNQLKATLTEMWNSELQLRTFKPQEALPYEYKALRMLKELQQKSRSYVAKTGVKTTPLKLEKRLTGDLSKITQPVKQQDLKRPAGATDLNRVALGILEQLKQGTVWNESSVRILDHATQQLGKEATAKPGEFLAAYQSMKKITQAMRDKTVTTAEDLATAEYALQKLVMAPGAAPQPVKVTAGMELSRQYYKKLNGSKD